eukprot:scaffold186059_cov18-Prasinocladus_malaysianus.AAC.1
MSLRERKCHWSLDEYDMHLILANVFCRLGLCIKIGQLICWGARQPESAFLTEWKASAVQEAYCEGSPR